jgi:hypothetical protein
MPGPFRNDAGLMGQLETGLRRARLLREWPLPLRWIFGRREFTTASSMAADLVRAPGEKTGSEREKVIEGAATLACAFLLHDALARGPVP